MPTIDIRGKAAGAGGKIDPKAIEAQRAETERRKSLVETYQRLQRDEIERATQDRKAAEALAKKQSEQADKAALQAQKAADREESEQEKARRDAAKAEKARQKFEETEIKKKQIAERRVAEKAEREKTRVEQSEIKKKQSAELKAAMVSEKEKQKYAKQYLAAEHENKVRDAKAAATAQKNQARQAAQTAKAAVSQSNQQAAALIQQQATAARGYKAVRGMQPMFGRQQQALLNHFNNANNPPPPPGSPGAGGAVPPPPPEKPGIAEGIAEAFTGAAIASAAKKFGMIVAGLTAAAIETPLIPGQIMRGILTLAGPAIDLQKQSSAMGRAGKFGPMSMYDTLRSPNGTTQGTEWMSDLMLTPEKAMQSLNAYGIAPKSMGKALDLASTFAGQSLMPGFSGMPQGTVEAAARQRDGYISGNTGGTTNYLAAIAGVMEMAVSKGMDRAKVLDNIEKSIDTLAHSGAAGISTKGTLDMVSRFAAAGTPGGRTGEQAASTMSALGGFASNPSSNPGAMFLAYSQMGKFGGLRKDTDVKDFLGEENWKSMSPKVREKMVKDVTDAAADGNTFAAFQIATQVGMGANPGRMAEIVQPGINAAFPSYLRTAARGSIMGGVQNSYAYEAGQGASAPNGIQVSNDFIKKNTPPGVGQMENLASQATLAGAQSELENFVPIVRNATEALEKFGHTVGTADKIFQAIHPQQSEPQNFKDWWRSVLPSTKESMPQSKFQ